MGHPIFARIYARRSVSEEHLQARYRRQLLAGLSGRVLEVGCGNGLNFVHYPSTVSEVVGIEPEPYLRDQARHAAAELDVRCTVIDARAETFSKETIGTFDAAVFSLVLCSVPDPLAVLRRTKEVLDEGAGVRFYEHVVSSNPKEARIQRLLAPAWKLLAGGCRPNQDTLSLIREEFEITEVESFDFCPGSRIPSGLVAPHLVARGVHRSS
jgi:SAM-dependent methyltransferase